MIERLRERLADSLLGLARRAERLEESVRPSLSCDLCGTEWYRSTGEGVDGGDCPDCTPKRCDTCGVQCGGRLDLGAVGRYDKPSRRTVWTCRRCDRTGILGRVDVTWDDGWPG